MGSGANGPGSLDALDLDLDVDPGGQVEALEGLHGLAGRLDDVRVALAGMGAAQAVLHFEAAVEGIAGMAVPVESA